MMVSRIAGAIQKEESQRVLDSVAQVPSEVRPRLE